MGFVVDNRRQFLHWKGTAGKARLSKSKVKAMMIIVFDIQATVERHWVFVGGAKLWMECLHHDNAHCIVNMFLAKTIYLILLTLHGVTFIRSTSTV